MTGSGAGSKLGFRFYKTAAGGEPVREWLMSQQDAVKKRIGSDMLDVQFRWPISKPLVDGLGKGLYEVRSTHDGTEYRVLFCIVSGAMIALVGFIKKTQRTPSQHLQLARSRQQEVEAE